MRFRQSIHGALHLGTDFEQRQRYRKLLHKVYGDASKVVHADRNSGTVGGGSGELQRKPRPVPPRHSEVSGRRWKDRLRQAGTRLIASRRTSFGLVVTAPPPCDPNVPNHDLDDEAEMCHLDVEYWLHAENEEDPAVRAEERGRSSPPQAVDPRFAGLGDLDLEAVDTGPERMVIRRDPDDEAGSRLQQSSDDHRHST